MGLLDMLKGRGVTSDALATNIAKARDEVARLLAEHDQAEAAVVAAVADDSYADAAKTAEKARDKLAAARERLARMERAHSEVSHAEQQVYIARLKVQLEAEAVRRNSRYRELGLAIEVENQRHQEAMASLTTEQQALSRRECPVLLGELRMADSGVTERNIRRVAELKDRVRKLNQQIDDLSAERQPIDAEYKKAFFLVENPSTFGHSKSSGEHRQRLAEASEKLAEISGRLDPLKHERARLQEEIRTLTNVAEEPAVAG